MKLRALTMAVALLAAVPAFAQKIYIDYDQSYSRGKVESFSWYETSGTSVKDISPLMHSRIVNAIEHHLSQAGLREAASEPDVYVTYHTSTTGNFTIETKTWGYFYPVDWWFDYYGSAVVVTGERKSGTIVHEYKTGTLIVDVWDARTNEMVWRGTATDITVSPSPSKMQKRLEKALRKMVDEWASTKRGR